MILKIATNNGWKFIDNITEIHVEKSGLVKFNEKPRVAYHEAFLTYATFGDHGLTRILPLGVASQNYDADFGVAEIYAEFKDSELRSYLVDSGAYLMSDEGKTIERIN